MVTNARKETQGVMSHRERGHLSGSAKVPRGLSEDLRGAGGSQAKFKISEVTEAFAGLRNRKCGGGWGQREVGEIGRSGRGHTT